MERRAASHNVGSGQTKNDDKIYAIKVIVKEKLVQKDISEKLQMVNEI